MITRLGITSLKGGVGKTTIATLLSLHFAMEGNHKVLVIDLDPQGGATSLLLGGKINGYTVADFLEAVNDGDNPADVIEDTIHKSSIHENIFIMPANKNLVNLSVQGVPANLLGDALDEASDELPADMLTIIDTGTMPYLVSMGIQASQIVLVPVMLSKQAVKPTANTLATVVRAKKMLAGLVPVSLGTTQWEQSIIDRWDAEFMTKMNAVVFPGLQQSKAIARGQWVTRGIPNVVAGTVKIIANGVMERVVSV